MLTKGLPSLKFFSLVDRGTDSKPLSLKSDPGPFEKIYLETYGFADLPPSTLVYRRMGLLAFKDSFLGVHILIPPQVKGTVFFFHGYLDHSGAWTSVWRKILERGWGLVGIDLPGHGFSFGERGDIQDFSLYGRMVDTVLSWASLQTDLFLRPWVGLGHSTGAASIWIYLSEIEVHKSRSGFDTHLFLSPLVRSTYWHTGKVLGNLFGWAAPYWKSRTVRDPLLDIPYFPLHWAQALWNWESKVATYPVLNKEGWIIQGTKDDVVDWPYSIAILTAKLPKFRVIYVERAGHVPYTQTPEARTYVEKLIEVLDRKSML
ncbi:MAG: alpha/beta fold hydrolase, partial [Spirochaetales bacterium]